MKASFTPDAENPADRRSPFWDNTDLVAKVLYRVGSHGILFLRALRNGASLKGLLITRAPFLFKDSPVPPSMHVEFTSACNLKCVYCNNPHFAHPRGVMNDATFDRLIDGLRACRVDRLCIGGGEATLHPKFGEYARRLKQHVPLLSIVTNGHWQRKGIAEDMLRAPIDLIEVSVEAGDRGDFERMRIGADYDALLKNLRELKRLRDATGSPSMINLRMMVRPSQRGHVERESARFWRPFADHLMPQYVLKDDEIVTIDDAYTPRQGVDGAFPKCSLPFRNMQVRSSGDVAVCQISGSSLIPGRKVIAGNVEHEDIAEIWSGRIMSQYRKAHRTRDTALMPICKGCKGC